MYRYVSLMQLYQIWALNMILKVSYIQTLLILSEHTFNSSNTLWRFRHILIPVILVKNNSYKGRLISAGFHTDHKKRKV